MRPTPEQNIKTNQGIAEKGRVALTRKSFADRWELSERYVNELIHHHVLPTVKLGRRCVRIPIEQGDAALMRFVNRKAGS
jgi:hypothetical protein